MVTTVVVSQLAFLVVLAGKLEAVVDLLYLCAFCAEGMSEEEDAIQHMLREHGEAIR